jgi:hypothetical protein
MIFGFDLESEEDLFDRMQERERRLQNRSSILPEGLEEKRAYIRDEDANLKYYSKHD